MIKKLPQPPKQPCSRHFLLTHLPYTEFWHMVGIRYCASPSEETKWSKQIPYSKDRFKRTVQMSWEFCHLHPIEAT